MNTTSLPPFAVDFPDEKPRTFMRMSREGSVPNIIISPEGELQIIHDLQQAAIITADGAVEMLMQDVPDDPVGADYWSEVGRVRLPWPAAFIEFGVIAFGGKRLGFLCRDNPNENKTGQLEILTAIDNPGSRVIFPSSGIIIPYDADGKPLDAEMTFAFPDQLPESERKTFMHVTWCITGTLLSVISMLHGSNVEAEPIPIEPTAAKHAGRRFGHRDEGYRHHVLTIDGKRAQRIASEMRMTQKGLMPEHMCRGGWHRYGPAFGNGLLFGKLSGEFWVPRHVKGNPKNGRISKDYKINPN